ncbi:hypothetical protein [Streptomyces rapamycinicus]|uniref:hypothetical protein n=1 Tax=Streptomyces rapamycinicus TaxID=1226757 RepID=UPI0030B8FC03
MTRRLLLSYLALALLVLVGLEIPLGYFYARGEESRFSQGVERDASMLAEVAEENIEKHNLEALPSWRGSTPTTPALASWSSTATAAFSPTRQALLPPGRIYPDSRTSPPPCETRPPPPPARTHGAVTPWR